MQTLKKLLLLGLFIASPAMAANEQKANNLAQQNSAASNQNNQSSHAKNAQDANATQAPASSDNFQDEEID